MDRFALLAVTRRRDEAVAQVRALLASHGLDEPTREARLLVCAAAGLTALDLIRAPDAPLDDEALTRVGAFAGRRAAGEPLSRILGKREFWSLDLAIGPATLDPRADTETLVSAALDWLGARRSRPLRILDLGTGSGAILCALLSECPAAFGIGVDFSPAAALVAKANLAACRLAARSAVLAGSWADALAGRFDLVVSNPPYIASGEIFGLAPEVRDHDPALALDGGADGLDAFRALAPQIARLLAPGGGLALEHGFGQGEAVQMILERAGLHMLPGRADLGGVLRVALGAARSHA